MHKILLSLSFLILCFAQTTHAKGNSLSTTDLLAQDYLYKNVSISPDGSKLAVSAWVDGRGRIIVLDTNTFKTLGMILFRQNAHPDAAIWVNNERIVTRILQSRPSREQLAYYGELYAANYDGSRGLLIYGMRVDARSTGTKINRKQSTRGWATVLHTLPDEDREILIASQDWSDDQGEKPTVHRLNVYSGKMSRRLTESPLPAGDFIVDSKGNVRIAYSESRDGRTLVHKLDLDTEEWTQIDNEVLGDSFNPVALDRSNENLYVTDSGGTDKSGLYTLNLNDESVEHIFTDENVSLTNITFSADGIEPYAVRVDDGRPSYILFGERSDEAALYKEIIEIFPGSVVTLSSRNKDGSKWIVRVVSDISPSEYYLFDKAENRLSFLFRNLEKLPIEKMSESTPIKFTARDGREIPGYISYPVNLKADEKAPLVALVHGGPHGVRDYWTFNREVQVLTAQGFAVLRVNFRGSAGMGIEHHRAGYKHWGDKIQFDIIDGIKWASQQDKVDASKICIMGASFGAYSAVMSATIEPELFSCVVANAGLYDLNMMYEEGDIPEILYGKDYLRRVLGTEQAELAKFSPINFVERLQAPVLIAHGKRDRRTPFVHAENLKAAMDRHGKKYEWFVRNSEGHGFFNQENRTEYLNEVVNFMNKHLR